MDEHSHRCSIDECSRSPSLDFAWKANDDSLAITAFVFLSFVTVVWGVSFAFGVLQSANPLSADALRVFGVLESILIRVDAAACGIVLLFGITRYILNVMKG